MEILITDIYCKKPNSRVQLFNDGGLLWTPSYCWVYELNLTAYFVLQLTDGSNSVTVISAALTNKYDICIIEAELDIKELYKEWFEQEIIEKVI